MSGGDMVMVNLRLPSGQTQIVKVEPAQNLREALATVLSGDDLSLLNQDKIVLHNSDGRALAPSSYTGADLSPGQTYDVVLDPARMVG